MTRWIDEAPTMDEVRVTAEGITKAVELLNRVRDVKVTFQVAWQRLDNLPDDAVEELTHRLEAAAMAWSAEQPDRPRMVTNVKHQQLPTVDTMAIQMALPTFWSPDSV